MDGDIKPVFGGLPCLIREGDEWTPCILYPNLSSNQMAKVATEDGWWRDVWWSKVRQTNVPELMDNLDYGEDW